MLHLSSAKVLWNFQKLECWNNFLFPGSQIDPRKSDTQCFNNYMYIVLPFYSIIYREDNWLLIAFITFPQWWATFSTVWAHLKYIMKITAGLHIEYHIIHIVWVFCAFASMMETAFEVQSHVCLLRNKCLIPVLP